MAVLYLSDPARGAVFQAAFAQALPEVPFHIGSTGRSPRSSVSRSW
jgi:glyoxylate/hydroxypyruvate reductase A